MTSFRILMVDDTPEAREPWAKLLRLRGFEVVEANDGPEALPLLAEQAFDLIITDYQMPYMNGLEFVAAAQKAGCKLPVLLCSGNFGAVLEARKAGIEAFSKSTHGYEEAMESVQARRQAKSQVEL